MNKLLLSFIFLFLPSLSFGFSETEIDSLSSSGKKNFSYSPWRTELSLSIQRKLEFNSHIGSSDIVSSLFDPDKSTSFFDPNIWYYSLRSTINYSLANVAVDYKDWLKNSELFISSSFNSPFTGNVREKDPYGLQDYILYALGDIVLGATVPAYQNEDFLSQVSLSLIPVPLSRFSKQAGLFTTVNGAVSFLYFFKKRARWGLSFASGHSLSYNHYTKARNDEIPNIPIDSSQSLSLIYRQSQFKYLPSSINISSSYYFGINTLGTQLHDATVRSSASWKIRKRLYVNLSVGWKDRIKAFNPKPEYKNVRAEKPHFGLRKTFFIIGSSYSF